jgi:hypothetical protein
MNQQFGPLLYTISVCALPAIIAITFHEAAHGFVARLLGDDTSSRRMRSPRSPVPIPRVVRAIDGCGNRSLGNALMALDKVLETPTPGKLGAGITVLQDSHSFCEVVHAGCRARPLQKAVGIAG